MYKTHEMKNNYIIITIDIYICITETVEVIRRVQFTSHSLNVPFRFRFCFQMDEC